jgi:uncharacterized protein (TIGR02588 family)
MSVSAIDAPRRWQQQEPGSARRSAAEWVTLAVSTLLVAGLVGVTSYLFLTASGEPAAMTVQPRLDELYQAGGRFYAPVTVQNTGGKTAEEIRVLVSVTDGAGRTESSEFQIQFLAGGAKHQAVVSFGSDPRSGQLVAAVTSFLEP